MRLAALLLVLAAPAVPPAAAQVVDGRDVTGRWLARHVEGDAAASADLAHGRLEKVLVVHPGGRALLRGTDRTQGGGRPAHYTGSVRGRLLRLDGLDGAAVLRADGQRLTVVDPRGVATVYVRWPRGM